MEVLRDGTPLFYFFACRIVPYGFRFQCTIKIICRFRVYLRYNLLFVTAAEYNCECSNVETLKCLSE